MASSSAVALHAAAKQGDLAAVEQLLLQQVPVDAADALGRTPLLWAAAFGHPAIVQLLLRARAAANTATNVGGG
jgi:ankyrin repeat protein